MADLVDQLSNFRQNFESFVANYASNSKSQGIICKDTATRILRILRSPLNISLPQLKYYVKQKNIHLRDFPDLQLQGVLCLPNDNNLNNRKTSNQRASTDGIFGKYRRIAVKEEFFDIINEIHTQKGSSEHLGPRKTFREISRHHAYVPRDIVFGFVKRCPSCAPLYNEENSPLVCREDLVTLSNFENEEIENDFKPVLEEMVRNQTEIAGSDKSSEFPSTAVFLECKTEPETRTATSTSISPFLSVPMLPSSKGQKVSSAEEIMEADHFMAVGQVRIIDIQELLNLSSPPRRYSCLVHYIDLWSKYSVLWPLKVRDLGELASGLAKNVFAYFGSPKQIIYDTNFDEARQLEEALQKWSKQIKVSTGLQEPLASSGPIHWKVVDKLKELLAETWEDQLSKLQYISNTKLVTNHQHVSPYKAVLGKEPIAEAFADLADKHNILGDPSSHLGNIHKSLSSEPNLNSSNNVQYSLIPTSGPVISDICHITPSASSTNVNNICTSMNNTASSPILEKTVTHNLDSQGDENCTDASTEVPPYQMFHGFVPTTPNVCQIDLTNKESAMSNTISLTQSPLNNLNPVPIACTVNRAALVANKPHTMSLVDESNNHNFESHPLIRQQQPFTNENFASEMSSLRTSPTSNYLYNNANLSSLSNVPNVSLDEFQLSLVNFANANQGNALTFTNALSEEARLRLTTAEKQARHRTRLKEHGDYESYKKAHAEQQRRMRYRRKEREKLLPEAEQLRLLRERREKTKKRVAKWRALQKQKFERQLSQQTVNSINPVLPVCKVEPET